MSDLIDIFFHCMTVLFCFLHKWPLADQVTMDILSELINKFVIINNKNNKQEGQSGPESLTCTMCTSLVKWKVMI